MAAAHGRDPASIGCIYQVGIPDAAGVEQAAGEIRELAEVGVEHVYVTLPSVTRDLAELLDAAEALHRAVR
jgi:hypothetical protein